MENIEGNGELGCILRVLKPVNGKLSACEYDRDFKVQDNDIQIGRILMREDFQKLGLLKRVI